MRIVVIKSSLEIDQEASQKVLVDSFMHAYEDVPLVELNSEFTSTGDVRRFYEAYFKEEFENFKKGRLIWIEAYILHELVGWATFEIESYDKDAAYLNLLVVAPGHQKKGIGRALVFSSCSEAVLPNVQEINLLLRKVNAGGYKFYHKLGFEESDYQRKNFVDLALLVGLRWTRHRKVELWKRSYGESLKR